MHKLLQKQIQRHLDAGFDRQLLDNVLSVISQAYNDHDTERSLLEHSLEQVSEELNTRNAQLNVQLEELKYTHKNLAQSVALLDSILEATGEAIFAFDQKGELIRLNKSAKKIVEKYCAEVDISSAGGGFVLESLLQCSATFASDKKLLEGDHTANVSGTLNTDDDYYYEYYSSPQYTNQKVVGRVWCLRDITRLKENEEIIKYNALHDSLTSLPNRELFLDRLEHAIDMCDRTDGNIAVLLLDLDLFKKVNDSVGHQIGDQFLVEVAHRIHGCLRKYDTLGRFGGDEFVILLEQLKSKSAIGNVCSRILEEVRKPFECEMHSFYITSSIGVSVYTRDNADPQALLRQADLAMYHAKNNGRCRFEFFDPELERSVHHQVSMESQLRRALHSKEFTLFFQPKINLKTGKISGLEALVRWFPPNEAPVPPCEFIPIAERMGLIGALDNWVLQEACHQLSQWQKDGMGDMNVSINLSAQQFRDPELVSTIEKTIHAAELEGGSIEIEVTETLLMENFEMAINALSQLRDMGVKVAIDDFGTGYSSLQYLKTLPIDTLKIDRCFIRDIEENPEDQSIVSAIIEMGHNLDLLVVAEGAEKEESIRYLRDRHCDLVQGYYFYKPMSGRDVTALLQKQNGI